MGLRNRKKLQSWRDIRFAALSLMSRRGYEAVTIDDIARAANVSRTTFFNYFDSKKVVVFDPDPEDSQVAQRLMRERPTGEPLGCSLQAVFTQNVQRYSDRLALQKSIKARSPKLASSGRDVTDSLASDLRMWALEQDTKFGVLKGELFGQPCRCSCSYSPRTLEPGQPFRRASGADL